MSNSWSKINFLTLYGEHDNDKPFCGSQVITQVKGKLKYEDNWKIDSYEIEEVKLTDF